ncbi:MAG: orotidine-5'-phosphate decarboxylase [Patescibacteria group bacterium]
MKTHAFLELAEVQRETKTMYCAGLDPHPFSGGLQGNYGVYLEALNSTDKNKNKNLVYFFYSDLVRFALLKGNYYAPPINQVNGYVMLLSVVECYITKVIDILVKKCNIRVFKPQAGFYEQFGPLGQIMLSRIRQYIKNLEKEHGRIICILDCKRGDIATTQSAYFLGLMGNLLESWGIDYTPFDFDIINVTPWMGLDVMVMGDKENPGFGLKLMKEGKGIIVVNKSSNPTGPQYQEQIVDGGSTIQMQNVVDLSLLSLYHDLEISGLSTIGLVVGSTHICEGNIRKVFPGATLLVPGFGAQGGKFTNIMQELIPDGEWTGQGAIFSSSRGTMYPWETKFGGSGDVKNLETDLIASISNFRIAEEEAFKESGLKEKGIIYPF